jgi:hypothetical protein
MDTVPCLFDAARVLVDVTMNVHHAVHGTSAQNKQLVEMTEKGKRRKRGNNWAMEGGVGGGCVDNNRS